MKSGKKIFFQLLAFLAGPIIIISVSAILLLTNEDFYIKVIEGIDPIESFISARNSSLEKDIRREIEKKTGLTAMTDKVEKAKIEYNKSVTAWRKASRADEYDRLKKEMKELEDLKWAENSQMFKTGKDFEAFRKNKLKELKSKIEAIDEYRDKEDDAISKAEDIMEDREDDYEDLADDLADKKEEAKEIEEEQRKNLPNSIVDDVAKIRGPITKAFNELFLEHEVKRIIKKYIGFSTNRDLQVKNGNIYVEKLNVSSGMVLNREAVKLPGCKINLYVKDNAKSNKSQHLFSDVFVNIVDKTPDINNPWVIKRILNLSNNWIGETFGNRIIKKTGIRLEDGNINMDAITVKGKGAKTIDRAFKILTFLKKYLVFIPLFPILLYLLVAITGDSMRQGLKSMGSVIKNSFMLAFLVTFSILLVSLAPGLIFDIPIENTMVLLIAEKVISTTAIYFFGVLSVLLFALSMVGSIIAKIFGEKKKDVS